MIKLVIISNTKHYYSQNREIVEGIELLYEMPNKFSTQTVKWALDHSWDNITNKYLKVMINE